MLSDGLHGVNVTVVQLPLTCDIWRWWICFGNDGTSYRPNSRSGSTAQTVNFVKGSLPCFVQILGLIVGSKRKENEQWQLLRDCIPGVWCDRQTPQNENLLLIISVWLWVVFVHKMMQLIISAFYKSLFLKLNIKWFTTHLRTATLWLLSKSNVWKETEFSSNNIPSNLGVFF